MSKWTQLQTGTRCSLLTGDVDSVLTQWISLIFFVAFLISERHGKCLQIVPHERMSMHCYCQWHPLYNHICTPPTVSEEAWFCLLSLRSLQDRSVPACFFPSRLNYLKVGVNIECGWQVWRQISYTRWDTAAFAVWHQRSRPSMPKEKRKSYITLNIRSYIICSNISGVKGYLLLLSLSPTFDTQWYLLHYSLVELINLLCSNSLYETWYLNCPTAWGPALPFWASAECIHYSDLTQTQMFHLFNLAVLTRWTVKSKTGQDSTTDKGVQIIWSLSRSHPVNQKTIWHRLEGMRVQKVVIKNVLLNEVIDLRILGKRSLHWQVFKCSCIWRFLSSIRAAHPAHVLVSKWAKHGATETTVSNDNQATGMTNVVTCQALTLGKDTSQSDLCQRLLSCQRLPSLVLLWAEMWCALVSFHL